MSASDQSARDRLELRLAVLEIAVEGAVSLIEEEPSAGQLALGLVTAFQDVKSAFHNHPPSP